MSAGCLVRNQFERGARMFQRMITDLKDSTGTAFA